MLILLWILAQAGLGDLKSQKKKWLHINGNLCKPFNDFLDLHNWKEHNEIVAVGGQIDLSNTLSNAHYRNQEVFGTKNETLKDLERNRLG